MAMAFYNRKGKTPVENTKNPPDTATSTLPSKQRPTNVLKRLTLYERSKQQKVEQKLKLERLRAELMEDFTFVPTVPNRSRICTGSTSGSVFDRLYRTGGGSRSTPVKSTGKRTTICSQTKSPTTNSTVTSNSVSHRLEEMYEAGVVKMRARPVDDSHEREIRERRRDDKEINDFCTFQPQLTHTIKKAKIVMEPINQRQKPLRRKRPSGSPPADLQVHPALPREIVIAHSHPCWQTPPRAHATSRSDRPLILPLQEPCTVDRDYITPPRRLNDFFPAPMPSERSVGAETIVTEYGSI
jgi:hypothetical protein